MLNKADQEFLFRALDYNRVVLFLGAGFSPGAQNRLAQPVPTTAGLAKLLWEWGEYDGEYDGWGEDLGEIYDGCLKRGKALGGLRSLLEDQLLVSDAPEWYDHVVRPWWYRIYSTNVDNLIEVLFRRRADIKLETISAPSDDYRERDQFLRAIQYVKLNGSLPGDPRSLTFTPRQYARRTARHDRWYDHFVRDYVYHPTLFVGSELREPMFWQAIVEREERGENPEERPRSFLIVPKVSGPKLDILDSLNIRHVPARAEEFFSWLRTSYRVPSRAEVLKIVVPDAAEILDLTSGIPGVQDSLTEFLSAFPRVPTPEPQHGRPKTFFLGAQPTWADVASDFDAPREFTAELTREVREAWAEEQGLVIFGILGEGGAGKSTAIRRMATTLRQEGRQVFFSEGAERPLDAAVRVSLEAFPDRTILFVDNAHLMGQRLLDLVEVLQKCEKPPVVVFATRYNMFERRLRELVGTPGLRVSTVPQLSDQDIESLIKVLDDNRQLGVLETLSPDERRYELKVRAGKQLLVAMREATQGRGFDDIIRSEFNEVEDQEARQLYLCAAVASAEQIDLSQGQWLACGEVPPATALGLLRGQLKGLLYQNRASERISARHPVIAEYVIEQVAARGDLAEAYVRVLSALAHDIYGGQGRRGRAWRLFVRLINHAQVYDRFSENLDMARQIYEAISNWFRSDGHFWLQYANLEIEFGHPSLARPHMAHAEGLMPWSDQVQTTRAHLEMRLSLDASSLEEAVAQRRAAEDILLGLMEKTAGEDEYPHHVLLTQGLAWAHRWGPQLPAEDREAFYKRLNDYAEEATDLMPRVGRIKKVADAIKVEYLMLAAVDR